MSYTAPPMEYGNFLDTTTQNIAVANTPQIVTFNTTVDANGISVVTAGGKASNITFANTGAYLVIFSAVMNCSSGNNHNMNIWLQQNTSVVPNSNTLVSLPTANTYTTCTVSYIINANAGDYIQLWVSGDSTNNQLSYLPAAGSIPACPSMILTANKISVK